MKKIRGMRENLIMYEKKDEREKNIFKIINDK